MSQRNIGVKCNSWMENPRQRSVFQRRLLGWYELNRRDLPWRRNRDPYRVWVSEIMLQQTRVATVIPHYHKFLRRFPSVNKLAAARESSVLACWSGLGYYRRARMMHAAAKKVVRKLAGTFPPRSEDLAELPGIGRYTAAAIASISFGEPVAVVDGNVKRVLARIIGRPIAESEAWRLATLLLSKKTSGEFNQALMELGAVICLPAGPKCEVCPVARNCAGRGVLPKNKIAVPQKKTTIFYTLDRRENSVFLARRSDNEKLMPGMWELPEVPGLEESIPAIFTLRHSITVTDYTVRVIAGPIAYGTSGFWVNGRRLRTLPLTGLARKILASAKII